MYASVRTPALLMVNFYSCAVALHQGAAVDTQEIIMNSRILLAALLAAAIAPATAQTSVSVQIGQPGFYGRINIGDYPPPQLVYAQPLVIERQRIEAAPVYLRVPPGHMKNWRKHCGAYNACGQRVYFVRDEWYNNTYAPRYRQEQYREHGGQERDRERDHDDDHDHDRGHGKGHDKDHDNGHGHGHGKD
jgi:hypothetical protein